MRLPRPAALAVALFALAGCGAGEPADPDRVFLAILAEQQIDTPSPDAAVSLARFVCERLDAGAPLAGVIGDVASARGYTSTDAAGFAGNAVGTYCPQHSGAQVTG